MHCHKQWTILFVAAWGMFSLAATTPHAEESTGTPTRGRSAALLTALFYYDLAPSGKQAAVPGSTIDPAIFTSVSPGQALGLRERSKVVEFARSLVYEGGYYPKELYPLLGYENTNTARVARLTRQLDQARDVRPSPWEVAGRVGRSGISGSSDHWAMAPGGAEDEEISSPGTLAYLPALAVVYAAYPSDGLEAAAQLAILKDDDMRADSVARAAFSLLRQILLSQQHDKDIWLRNAAADSRNADTEHDLKSVRVRDWRYLRGEECAMGRLERAVYIWYKGHSYEQMMSEGRELLRSRESLAFLSALAAVTYGQEGLPVRMISVGTSDAQLMELINDLHDLATSEAVLKVAPEEKD